MKAVIHVNNFEHQKTHGAAMKSGLERHGIEVSWAGFDEPAPCDFAVIWGSPFKHPRVKEATPRLLVMEAGHIGGRDLTRLTYTSCGWNGLQRRGRYPKVEDGGQRWKALYADFMEPWRIQTEGYALLLGQVPGDFSLYGLPSGFQSWAQAQTNMLRTLGYDVVFRPHPLCRKLGHLTTPDGAEESNGTLAEDLAGASFAVAFNSTSSVESVLAGVPTVTLDEGAMAWDVTSHQLSTDRVQPDRHAWAHWLAYTQWRLDELSSGFAWEHIHTAMEG